MYIWCLQLCHPSCFLIYTSLSALEFLCCSTLLGRLACKHFVGMKTEAAALKVQRNTLSFLARKAYNTLRKSVLVIQTGLRSMDAHNKFRLMRRTKAATIIQVTTSFVTIKILVYPTKPSAYR